MTPQTEVSWSPERAQGLANPASGVPGAPGAFKSRLNEGADDYPAIITRLNKRWRVIICKGNLQWILQRKGGTGPNPWRGDSFCQTRSRLLLAIRERSGQVDAEAFATVMALPAHIRGKP